MFVNARRFRYGGVSCSYDVLSEWVNAREDLEGSGRFVVSEVRSENRGQFALLRIQREGEQGFLESSDGDERMMGKWSLSHRSLWVDHVTLGERDEGHRVRLIVEREPEEELRWVGIPGRLRRCKSVSEESRWSRILPRELVRKLEFEIMPHVGLWALKSPHRRNGGGRELVVQ